MSPAQMYRHPLLSTCRVRAAEGVHRRDIRLPTRQLRREVVRSAKASYRRDDSRDACGRIHSRDVRRKCRIWLLSSSACSAAKDEVHKLRKNDVSRLRYSAGLSINVFNFTSPRASC
jgi:hypothetical protein